MTLPFSLAVIGDVTDNAVEVEVVEGAGISEKLREENTNFTVLEINLYDTLLVLISF